MLRKTPQTPLAQYSNSFSELMDDCDSPYHLIVEYDYVIIDGICSEPQALDLTTRFRNFDHTNMLKDSFESVETISEQGKLNHCLIYWKTRV